MKLFDLTLREMIDGLKAKKFTARELTQAHLDRMSEMEHLKCFVTETRERALADADESDKRLAEGNTRPLEGIPFIQKDLFCTKGIRTTASSKILENFVPQYESTVSQKIKDAGTTLLGKANLDQFAMGSTTKTSAFANTINPWKKTVDDTDLTPGGSSGGSAAAVAAGLAPASTGTDTGGSIRQPAAFCGIVGLKPTYGRSSRFGCIAFASSLDTPGMFARTVEDCALVLEQMAGFDPKDSTSVNCPVPAYADDINSDMTGVKVGMPKECDVDGLSPEIRTLWMQRAEDLKARGAELVEVSLPHMQYALASYYIIAPAEASANLARYDGVRYGLRVEGDSLDDMYKKTRAAGFGDEVKRRILIGTFVLSAGFYDAYYMKAAKLRRLIWQDFKDAFEKCDVLLTPATPTPAFGLDAKMTPLEEYACDIYTVAANMAGIPGISVPVGLSQEGLPIGLQLLGNHFDEQKLLNVGKALEEISNFDHKPSTIC